MTDAPTQTLGESSRHDREALAKAAAVTGISRESLRQAIHAMRHTDLAAQLRAGSITVSTAYRIAREREGHGKPARRCNVSADNATDAMRVLLSHFTADQVLAAMATLGAFDD
jgi:hypothetical protein